MTLPNDFLALSATIGSNPLLVQGPGGNTSMKADGTMWIKASGTLLADATAKNIFVAVDPAKALAELDGAGDGSCRSALMDSHCKLRPSIETTFHAMMPQPFVFHFHSVNTIGHAISDEGHALLAEKLSGLSWVSAPYRKPGIELSRAIRDAVGDSGANVVVLQNHGVIVAGDNVGEVAELIDDVERRLDLPTVLDSSPKSAPESKAAIDAPKGWTLLAELAALANDSLMHSRSVSDTYYPDHVVFLGPSMPIATIDELNMQSVDAFQFAAVLVPGVGVFLKSDATDSQRAMLVCLFDVLSRIPSDWSLNGIGAEAEAELLNWDAEKYRQMLAKKNASSESV